MQGMLSDFLSLYETFDKDRKRQLNQILFSAIISFFKRGTTEGELELRIRGNGVIKKTWEDIKKGNPIVRTSGSLGSASRTRTNVECINKANLSGIRHFTRSDFRLLRYFELTRGQLGDSEKPQRHEELMTGKSTHTQKDA